MELMDLLGPDGVVAGLRVTSKKQVLQALARLAAPRSGLAEGEIFDVLLEREHLGSTGVGQGVAIPHGKLSGLKGLYGVFARLDRPVDFDSLDDEPVDLVFLLLAPENAGAEHLKALARVSRLLRDRSVCESLRQADGRDQIQRILANSHNVRAA